MSEFPLSRLGNPRFHYCSLLHLWWYRLWPSSYSALLRFTKPMQSVLNAAARLVFSASRYDRITPLLPRYLAEELHQSSADEARQRLRSASTSSFVVRRTRLSTIGDGAFPVAASRLWNTLPLNVTSESSISVFRKRLKTHLFSHSFPESPVVPGSFYLLTSVGENQIKSFISGNTAHRKTKKRQKRTETQKHAQNHKQTEGQAEKKQTTSTNYKLTTSTTPTHHSVNTVLSLKG